VVDYERLAEVQRIADEAQVDLEVRKARRLAGQEPAVWQAPGREPVKAAPSINVGKLKDAFHSYVEEQILRTVEMLGEEVARAGKQLRSEIEAKVMAEVRTSALAMANKLMMQREVREQGQREAERDILACRREIADLREELRALKAGGGAPGDRAWTNGTGARQ
jgi:hypothetical protein